MTKEEIEEIEEELYGLMIEVDGVPVGEVESREELQEKVDLTVKTVWDIIHKIRGE